MSALVALPLADVLDAVETATEADTVHAAHAGGTVALWAVLPADGRVVCITEEAGPFSGHPDVPDSVAVESFAVGVYASEYQYEEGGAPLVLIETPPTLDALTAAIRRVRTHVLRSTTDLDDAPVGTRGRDAAGYRVHKRDTGWHVTHNGKRLDDVASFLPITLPDPGSEPRP